MDSIGRERAYSLSVRSERYEQERGQLLERDTATTTERLTVVAEKEDHSDNVDQPKLTRISLLPPALKVASYLRVHVGYRAVPIREHDELGLLVKRRVGEDRHAGRGGGRRGLAEGGDRWRIGAGDEPLSA